jgi:hypothetical protein
MGLSSFDRAVEVELKGYHPLPLAPRSKVPLKGFDLDEHFRRDVPVAEDAKWYAYETNVGVKTGDLIVVDKDDKERAREFYKRFKSILKTVGETKRGAHFLFRSSSPGVATATLEDGDLKATGGYIVFPQSRVDGWQYRFVDGHDLVPFEELPVFDPNMVDMKIEQASVISSRTALTRGKINDAISYVMKKVESVQGQHGSNGLIRAISILRDGCLTEAEATVVMIDWNNSGKAVPPWPLKELTRAISRTYARGK